MPPVEGNIATEARGFLPVTWDALQLSDEFGDALLQRQVDLVKEELFGVVVSVNEEANYPLRVLNYAGKMVASKLITPGVDYWASQTITVTTDTPNEVASYTDRAARLAELGQKLKLELRQDLDDIEALLGKPKKTKHFARPGINTAPDDVLLTPNPRAFPRQYR